MVAVGITEARLCLFEVTGNTAGAANFIICLKLSVTLIKHKQVLDIQHSTNMNAGEKRAQSSMLLSL